MSIDPLQTWKDELENLPKVADPSWSLNVANWYADRIVNIETDNTSLDTAAGFTFTFPTALFASGLAAMVPTTDPASGIALMAAAWEAAILATTVVVAAGAFIPPTSPATLFSVVTPPTLIDPPSIVAGKAKIMELVGAPVSDDAQDSIFPEKFREATLLLTITVMGLDSTPTPAGPLPLTAPLVPLI